MSREKWNHNWDGKKVKQGEVDDLLKQPTAHRRETHESADRQLSDLSVAVTKFVFDQIKLGADKDEVMALSASLVGSLKITPRSNEGLDDLYSAISAVRSKYRPNWKVFLEGYFEDAYKISQLPEGESTDV